MIPSDETCMIPLIYIASPSYSGSTLLTFLLGAHSDIATIGELKWGRIDLETYACSCGALLKECPFWREVVQRMAARGLPFDLNRPPTAFRCWNAPLADRIARARVRGPLFEAMRGVAVAASPAARRAWSQAAAVNRGFMEIVLELQGARYFLDASKDPVRLKHLLDTGDYDPWVIHLVRDGRGVTYSTIKNKKFTAETSALDWVKTHEQLERLGKRLGPERMLRLHYEELCHDPPGALRRIFEFVGLAPRDVSGGHRDVEHHILGNKMRLQANNAIRLDETWRTALTPEDLATFERVAGEWNRRYGYR